MLFYSCTIALNKIVQVWYHNFERQQQGLGCSAGWSGGLFSNEHMCHGEWPRGIIIRERLSSKDIEDQTAAKFYTNIIDRQKNNFHQLLIFWTSCLYWSNAPLTIHSNGLQFALNVSINSFKSFCFYIFLGFQR